MTNRQISAGLPPEARKLEREASGETQPVEEGGGITLADIFKANWTIHYPATHTPDWQLTKIATLIQIKSTGSYVTGRQDKNFGTIVIHKFRFPQNGDALNAKIKLGAKGESGIVFNFISQNDYWILYYRHNDSWNPKDAIGVYHIHDGLSQRISQELPTNQDLSNLEVNFSVRKEGTKLLCTVKKGDLDEFTIELDNVDILASTGAGIYSRFCDDAEFLSLDAVHPGEQGGEAKPTILLPVDIEEKLDNEYEKSFSMQEIDLRPLSWVQEIQKLLAELVFAGKRFEIAEKRYNEEMSNFEITPEEINNIESYYRTAFNNKIDAEKKYEDLKAIIESEGIDILETGDLPGDASGKINLSFKKKILRKIVQTWKTFYIQYDVFEILKGMNNWSLYGSFNNRVRHSTFARTRIGLYRQTPLGRGLYAQSYVQKKWCETNYSIEYQEQTIQVNNSKDIFANLKEYIREKSAEQKNVAENLAARDHFQDIREYVFKKGEYIDQYGETLHDHVIDINENPDENREDILILKEFNQQDPDAGPSKMLVIKNPPFSGKQIHPPTFLFEENYVMDVGWSGIGLGEFSHSINLFPGETREMKIVTTKKRSWETIKKTSSKSKTTSSTETTDTTKRNDSFDEKLQDSFEKSDAFSSAASSSSSSSWDVSASANASFGFGSASVSAGYNASSSSSSSSSSSLAATSKKAKDLCKKASSEVSQNNKVSFGSTSEVESNLEEKMTGEDMESETSTIKISNINEGRTANYNFFQVTNIYSTRLQIENVKIHISTGVEIVPGTRITISKTYDIEDFGDILKDFRIYAMDDRKEIVKAIGAQILKRYTHIKDDPLEDDPIILHRQNDEGMSDHKMKHLRNTCTEIFYDPALFEVQNLKNEKSQADGTVDSQPAPQDPSDVPPDTELDSFLQRFPEDLLEFSRQKFKVQSLQIAEKDYYTINSGKYYVDAQIGLKPATEEYLEDRRQVETSRQKAIVREIRQRTKAGVFFQNLPETLTTLSVDGDEVKAEMESDIKT